MYTGSRGGDFLRKLRVTVPGESLGVIEEYIPGEGVLERGGVLASKYHGMLKEDNGRISVQPFRRPIYPPRVGEIALGEIRSADRSNFLIHLIALIKPRKGLLIPPVLATMSKRPVNLGVRPSDIVLVKIESIRGGQVTVTLAGSHELGAIRSFCPHCGTPLVKGVGLTLTCPTCGRIYLEKRISSRYGWNPFREGLIKYARRKG